VVFEGMVADMRKILHSLLNSMAGHAPGKTRPAYGIRQNLAAKFGSRSVATLRRLVRERDGCLVASRGRRWIAGICNRNRPRGPWRYAVATRSRPGQPSRGAMESTHEPVAVLGIGAMGHGMATSALRAGIRTIVWNRNPAASRDLAALGGEVAETAADAARRAAIVAPW
jgi:hypothetical protein